MEQRDARKNILQQYGVGPIQFSGTDDALYERHLTFDHVVDVKKADVREQFEAAARSVRDIISQRWLRTEDTMTAEESQARVLPVDGVSDRAIARQQRDQSRCSSPLTVEAARKEGH